MSEEEIPTVRLAMVAISRGEAFLTIYNKKWAGFAPPMSKIRTWTDQFEPGEVAAETPEKAAVRVAAEALGRPLGPVEKPIRHPKGTLFTFDVSGRDGRRRKYNIEFFTLAIDPGEAPEPLDGLPMAWLTLEEMATHQPVTSTTRRIAHRLKQWNEG